jgi:hypothetical protein
MAKVLRTPELSSFLCMMLLLRLRNRRAIGRFWTNPHLPNDLLSTLYIGATIIREKNVADKGCGAEKPASHDRQSTVQG